MGDNKPHVYHSPTQVCFTSTLDVLDHTWVAGSRAGSTPGYSLAPCPQQAGLLDQKESPWHGDKISIVPLGMPEKVPVKTKQTQIYQQEDSLAEIVL